MVDAAPTKLHREDGIRYVVVQRSTKLPLTLVLLRQSEHSSAPVILKTLSRETEFFNEDRPYKALHPESHAMNYLDWGDEVLVTKYRRLQNTGHGDFWVNEKATSEIKTENVALEVEFGWIDRKKEPRKIIAIDRRARTVQIEDGFVFDCTRMIRTAFDKYREGDLVECGYIELDDSFWVSSSNRFAFSENERLASEVLKRHACRLTRARRFWSRIFLPCPWKNFAIRRPTEPTRSERSTHGALVEVDQYCDVSSDSEESRDANPRRSAASGHLGGENLKKGVEVEAPQVDPNKLMEADALVTVDECDSGESSGANPGDLRREDRLKKGAKSSTFEGSHGDAPFLKKGGKSPPGLGESSGGSPEEGGSAEAAKKKRDDGSPEGNPMADRRPTTSEEARRDERPSSCEIAATKSKTLQVEIGSRGGTSRRVTYGSPAKMGGDKGGKKNSSRTEERKDESPQLDKDIASEMAMLHKRVQDRKLGNSGVPQNEENMDSASSRGSSNDGNEDLSQRCSSSCSTGDTGSGRASIWLNNLLDKDGNPSGSKGQKKPEESPTVPEATSSRKRPHSEVEESSSDDGDLGNFIGSDLASTLLNLFNIPKEAVAAPEDADEGTPVRSLDELLGDSGAPRSPVDEAGPRSSVDNAGTAGPTEKSSGLSAEPETPLSPVPRGESIPEPTPSSSNLPPPATSECNRPKPSVLRSAKLADPRKASPYYKNRLIAERQSLTENVPATPSSPVDVLSPSEPPGPSSVSGEAPITKEGPMESLQSVNAENASKSKRTLRKPSRFDVPPPAKTSATSPRPAASPASAPELRRAVARRNSEGETYVPGTNSTKLIGTILPQLAMYSEVHLYRKDIQAVDGDEESVTWTIEEVPRRFGSSHNAPSSFVPTVASTKMRINHYPRHHVPGIPVHSDELQQASESPITPPPELANNQENDYASQLFEKILPKLTMYSEIHLSVKETKFGSNGGAAISWNVRLVKDDCES